MRRRFALVLAIGAILLIVIPWRGFQDHPHWGRIGWIPFVSPPIRVRDIVANTLLFMPLGAAVALNSRPERAVRHALMTAAILSLSGEAAQIYSHGRFPSATDFVTNLAGAGFGAAALRWRLQPAMRGESGR